jgi:hypothetical protein
MAERNPCAIHMCVYPGLNRPLDIAKRIIQQHLIVAHVDADRR